MRRYILFTTIRSIISRTNATKGRKRQSGSIVIFYNDDVYPLQPDWIERLIEYLWVPGVGGVSPKLLHANDTIQYAGMISGTPGLCGTAYNNIPRRQCGFVSHDA